MHTFRYALGHRAGETMTVGELKEKLDDYPDEMPVLATWESVMAYINSDNFFVENVCKGFEEDRRSCLVIDVEAY